MPARPRRLLLASMLAAAVVLAACERSTPTAAAPPPIEVTADATGHYCGMLLAEHEGPKGQIHLSSRSEPVWFSSVRDTVASWRAEVERLGERRDEALERALARAGLARREELEDLALRVAQLEHRLRLLERDRVA